MKILEIIERTSRERDLRFLVIGGHAVNVHGYSRTTCDLDLMIERDQRGPWTDALQSCHYSVGHQHEIFMQFEPPDEHSWPIDFMLVSAETFSGMWAESVSTSLDGTPVRIPSLRHLLALKFHVIKQSLRHRSVKDWDDVIRLIDANSIDVRSESFKQLCQRYGNLDTYEQILRLYG
jgi:predicted nucleotidyltransferase